MRGEGHGGKADDQDQKPKRKRHITKHSGTLPYSEAKSKRLFGHCVLHLAGRPDEKTKSPEEFSFRRSAAIDSARKCRLSVP
jgi:hypothetical protein